MTFSERRLAAFVAVADSGSLGRAAELLHMTQPALSRSIQEMESRLGCMLFERHSKGMTLTPAGDVLIGYARQLTFDMEQARDALGELDGAKRGRVRIGAVAAANCGIVSRAIGTLIAEAPGLTVEVLEAPDGELVEALANRRIDLMVGSDRLHHDDIVALDHCGEGDSFAVCCGRRNGLGDAPHVTLADLRDARWVMLQRGRTPRTLFDGLVAEAEWDAPDVVIETNSIGAQVALIQATSLLGWLPASVIADQIAAGTLRRLTVPELTLTRRFRVYRRRMGYLHRPAELLLSHIVSTG